MSWSDDMRCLHCDGKLPLYRKITNGQFCSGSHRRAYWQEQERLAIERLHQTHDSLRAYRPAEALENAFPRIPAGNQFYVDGQFPEDALSAEELARTASNTDRVVMPGFVLPTRPQPLEWSARGVVRGVEPEAWAMVAPMIWHGTVSQAAPQVSMAGKQVLPLPASVNLNPTAVQDSIETIEILRRPIHCLTLAANPETAEFELLRVQPQPEQIEISQPEIQQSPIAEPEPLPVQIVQLPLARIEAIRAQAAPLAIAPRDIRLSEIEIVPLAISQPQLSQQPAEENWEPLSDWEPVSEGLLALPRVIAGASPAPVVAIPSQCIEVATSLQIVPSDGGVAALEVGLAQLLPLSLTLNSAVAAHNLPKGDICALEVNAQTEAPAIHLTSPPRSPRLRLGRGCRYAIAEQPGVIAPRELPAERALPSATPDFAVSSAALGLPNNFAASTIGLDSGCLLPIAMNSRPVPPEAAQISSPTPPVCELTGSEPLLPVLRLEPAEGAMAPPPKKGFLELAGWNPAGALDPNQLWSHAVDFWQHAPRDMKLLAIAIPVLLGLALHPSLPKVSVTAPSTSGEIKQGIEGRLRAQFINVKHTLANRAGVELNDDFRSGLDDWQTRGDLSAGWSFDATGFVKPTALALYRPSMRLADYDMQFLGLIDKKALSFVARAQDFDNYYVIKLVVLKPGPLPTIGVSRYAVIDGKAQARTDVIAPIDARPDMLYRVSLSVYGETYLLSLQGKVVDSWSEKRLNHGGVGFFANRGEEGRLRWVQVTHQYDMLGRLCAYLAPYEIPTTNGSW